MTDYDAEKLKMKTAGLLPNHWLWGIMSTSMMWPSRRGDWEELNFTENADWLCW